jgi:putative hydroxymethylpyrimidine transporter CytX
MSVTPTTTSATQPSERVTQEAPLTLTTHPPRPLGFLDQLALWGNLGISLFGPLTGALIATTAGSVGLGIAAIVVGCALGAILLGASAVMGTVTGAPAMVTLRGLVGRRGSVLPTVLNIAQNIGWATMEIIVISTAAVAVVGQAWRWPFVILAGAAATLMAIRPLGSVRLLRKIMVWLVLAASTFLFVQVLLQPRQSIPQDSVLGFWPAVDLAIAGVVSFAPLAADYSRHSRTRRAAFWGASLGYGLAAIAYYALGVFAVVNLGASDVITALVTLPAGAIAITILLVDEVDEAFANVYSTTMSVHNIIPQLDRRIIALIIGVTATLLAGLLDFGQYQSFLFLIGSVFVPLYAVAAVGRVQYFAVPSDAGHRLGLRVHCLSAGLSRHCARLGRLLGLARQADRIRPARLAWLICRGHRGRWARDVDRRFALALPAGRPSVTFSHVCQVSNWPAHRF